MNPIWSIVYGSHGSISMDAYACMWVRRCMTDAYGCIWMHMWRMDAYSGITNAHASITTTDLYYIYIYISAGPWPRACQIVIFVFVATFVTSVRQLLHLSISLQHVLRLFSIFTISAIIVVHCLDNCFLLLRKRAREGGLSGSPWPQASSTITPHFTF